MELTWAYPESKVRPSSSSETNVCSMHAMLAAAPETDDAGRPRNSSGNEIMSEDAVSSSPVCRLCRPDINGVASLDGMGARADTAGVWCSSATGG